MNGTPRVFSESVTMAGITKFCPNNNWDIFVDKNQHNLESLCNFMDLYGKNSDIFWTISKKTDNVQCVRLDWID